MGIINFEVPAKPNKIAIRIWRIQKIALLPFDVGEIELIGLVF
jgi:tRNA (Thr-GGU) A37 N-methylase